MVEGSWGPGDRIGECIVWRVQISGFGVVREEWRVECGEQHNQLCLGAGDHEGSCWPDTSLSGAAASR